MTAKIIPFPLPTCNLCQLEEALKLAADIETELGKRGETKSIDARVRYVEFKIARGHLEDDLKAVQDSADAGELKPSEVAHYRAFLREHWFKKHARLLDPVMQSVKRG